MKRKYRILIAEPSSRCRRIYRDALSELDVIEDIVFAADGIEALDLFAAFKPNVLITELLIPGVDGFSLVESMPQGSINILSTICANEHILRQSNNYNFAYIFLKPLMPADVKKRLKDVLLEEYNDYNLHLNKTKRITNDVYVYKILVKCGVPVHIKGFRMLKYATLLAAENPDLLYSVTGKLYPQVAEKFCTTWSRVERNIRTAIEAAYNKGNLDFLNELFGYTIDSTRGKPTNSEFIAMIADRIWLRTGSIY